MKDIFYSAIMLSLVVLGCLMTFAASIPLVRLFGMFVIAFGACGVSWMLVPYLTSGLGLSFYYSSSKINRTPEQLSRIEGLAISGNVAEAVEELQEILRKNFNLVDARKLLVNIYLNYLHDRDAAKSTMREYFTASKHLSNGDSLDLLLQYGDLLGADGESNEALQYFEQELKRGKYSKADKTLLTNRLDALRNS